MATSNSKKRIKIVFRSEDGKLWDSYTQALVATVIQSNTYLDTYKLEIIVKILTDNFYIKEKKDEAKRTGESSEQGQEA